jgi:hypothetical protein
LCTYKLVTPTYKPHLNSTTTHSQKQRSIRSTMAACKLVLAMLCSSESPAPRHGCALPPAPCHAAPHCVPTSTTSQQPCHLVARVVNDAVTSAPPPLPQHRGHARLAAHLTRAHATITCKSTHARCCRAVASSLAPLLCAHAAWAPHVALPRLPPHAPRSQRHRRQSATAAAALPPATLRHAMPHSGRHY